MVNMIHGICYALYTDQNVASNGRNYEWLYEFFHRNKLFNSCFFRAFLDSIVNLEMNA